jgi:hypothetical protein
MLKCDFMNAWHSLRLTLSSAAPSTRPSRRATYSFLSVARLHDTNYKKRLASIIRTSTCTHKHPSTGERHPRTRTSNSKGITIHGPLTNIIIHIYTIENSRYNCLAGWFMYVPSLMIDRSAVVSSGQSLNRLCAQTLAAHTQCPDLNNAA